MKIWKLWILFVMYTDMLAAILLILAIQWIKQKMTVGKVRLIYPKRGGEIAIGILRQ